MSVAILEKGLPSREALREFLKQHEYSTTSAYEAERAGKKLTYLFCDQEAYGDRSYYFCEEDGAVYSNYFTKNKIYSLTRKLSKNRGVIFSA